MDNTPDSALICATDAAATAAIGARLADEQLIAIDTEFVRESTYFARLCLVQIASADFAACVDCLADVDQQSLTDLLTGNEQCWVAHSARQDLEVIWQSIGRMPARLIDTQIAASLAGYPPQIGLQSLLAETLDVNLGKQFTRLDWSRRPLPVEALHYAIDDVRHLIAMWRRLEQRLHELGRTHWLEEECATLLSVPPETDTTTIWSRLKSVQPLPAEQQRAAFALVEWRERRARAANRPRRWILADDALVRIARAMPGNVAELAAVPDLGRHLPERSGPAIIAAIAEFSEADFRERVTASAPSEPPDRQRVKALKTQLLAHAQALGVHPEVLATRRDIERIARGESPWPPGSWRTHELAELLASSSA